MTRVIPGNENSAQSFSDRSFWKSLRIVDVPRLRVMDVRAQMLVFSMILSALTEVLGRGIGTNGPGMSAASQKLPLWADFFVLEIQEGLKRFLGLSHVFSCDFM